MATADVLKGEKRAREQKILKHFMSEETTSAEKVLERVNVEEKAKMHHKGEEEIVGDNIKTLQEGFFSMIREPEVIGDISVTDGSKPQGSKTKEKFITGRETKKKNVAAVQDEPSEQKEFSVQQTVEEIASKEIKHVKKDTEKHKEATVCIEREAESPMFSIQKQLIEPQQVTFDGDIEKERGFSIPELKDKPKFAFELSCMKDIKPLEKASLQNILRQTDQENKHLEADNAETTLKTQETGSLEFIKSLEKGSPKPRIVKSEEAEEKSYATQGIQSKTEIHAKPESTKQKTLTKKPVTQEISLQSIQLRDSQSKENKLAETEEKLLENVSHKAENKIDSIQLALSEGIPKKEIQDKADSLKKKTLGQILQLPQEKDIAHKQLLKEDAPEKSTRSDENIRDQELNDQLQKPEDNKKLQPSKQEDQAVETTEELDKFQLRTVTVKDQTIQSRVVKLKDKLVKFSPMEGATEIKPNRKIVTPGSLLKEETATDKILQKPEITSQGWTPKEDVSQKVRQQTSQVVKSKLLTNKDNTCVTEKGIELETSQTEVPLKDKEQKVVTCEDTQAEVQSEVREDEVIPTERKKTKIRNIFRKSSSEEKEKSPQKKVETQKQEQQRPIKGKAQDVQAKTVRIKNETAEVTTVKVKDATKHKLIERIPSVTPVTELTHEESLIAGDNSEKCDRISEAGQVIVEKERLGVISEKIKPPPTERPEMSSKVLLESGENKIIVIQKITKLEQAKRYTAEVSSEELPSEKFTLEDREKLTTEDITLMRVTDKTAEIVSGEAIQKYVGTELREQEHPEGKASTADLTEPSSGDLVTEKIRTVAKPEEAKSVQTESESVTAKEPHQKLSKPQKIIAEQDQLNVSTVKDENYKAIPIKVTKNKDGTPEKQAKMKENTVFDEEIDTTETGLASPEGQLKVSTVKDKTVKVSLLKETKTTQAQIERKIAATTMKEETSIESEVAPEKNSEIKVTEFAAVEEDVSDVPDEEIPQSEPRFSKEEISESDDTSKLVSHKKDEPQKGKRPTSAKSEKISIEEAQSRTVAVTDEYSSIAPSEETQIRQGQIKKVTSVVPVMEKAAEKTPTIKDKDIKTDILQLTVASNDVVKDITFKKEKEIQVKKITSNLDPNKSKKDKVAAIEKKTLKRQEQIDSTASEASECDVTYKQCLAEYKQTKTKAEVSEREVKEKKLDEVPQDKDVAQKFAKMYKITGEVVKDETDKIPPTIATKPGNQEEIEQKSLVTTLHDKPSNEQTAEEIQSKIVTVKDKYSSVIPFEVTETKQEQVKSMFSVPPVMEVASEKSQIVKVGELIKEQITVEQAKNKCIKDKPEKIEVKTGVSRAVEQDLTHQITLVEKNITKTDIPIKRDTVKTIEASEHISLEKEAVKREGQKLDKKSQIISEDVPTNMSKSPKDKQGSLGRSTKMSLKEVQSQTVTVKDVYGIVIPFEVTGTKQEQVESKFSVAPVMKVASERSQIVKNGDGKSDTLHRVIIPYKDVKDITSRKEGVYESSEASLIRHSQSPPPSTKESVEILSEKQAITEQDTQATEVTNHFKSDQIASVDTKQKQTQQKAEWTAVSHPKTQETLIGKHNKTEAVDRERSPGLEEIKYDRISQKKSYSVKDQHQVTAEGIQSKTHTVKDVFLSAIPIGETKQEQSLGERDESDVITEEIQSKVVTIKDRTGTVSSTEEAKMKLEHTESKATEGASKELLKSVDRPEKDILKEEIRTAGIAKVETKDEEQWPKSKQTEDEAARVTPDEGTKVRQEQIERHHTVTGREQINREPLLRAMKKNEEMYPFQETVNEQIKISEKYKPTTMESKADIDILPWFEPLVTDKTKQNITEKKTTDYKTDTPEYREGASIRWKSEVEQSCLEADVQYMTPQEGETITRKVGGAQGIQSIIETRVLSLEPEGKANVSHQQSSRGI